MHPGHELGEEKIDEIFIMKALIIKDTIEAE